MHNLCQLLAQIPLWYITISTLYMQHYNVDGDCINNIYHLPGPHPDNDAQYPPMVKSPYLEEDCNVFLLLMSSSACEIGHQKRLMTEASLFPTNSLQSSAHEIFMWEDVVISSGWSNLCTNPYISFLNPILLDLKFC